MTLNLNRKERTMALAIGINLFVIQSIGKADFRQVAMGSLPFVTIFVLFTATMVFFPGIVTWLPSLMQK